MPVPKVTCSHVDSHRATEIGSWTLDCVHICHSNSTASSAIYKDSERAAVECATTCKPELLVVECSVI